MKFEDNWNPEVDNDFKVLEWKARIQAEIYEEIKGMTPRERIAYFHKGSEKFREEQRRRRAELAKK